MMFSAIENQSQIMAGSSKKVIIDGRFYLKKLICKHSCFNIYQGLDVKTIKPVNVYIKPVRMLTYRATWNLTFPRR